MREILLSQRGKNKGKYVALVDDADYDFLMQWKWCAMKGSRNMFYAARIRSIKMHRVIMGVSDPKILIDHKDRNSLNNQRSNLRIATKSQNCFNRFKYDNKASKYIGVSPAMIRKARVWRSIITFNGKKFHLGYFNSEELAAIARDEAAKKYFGEYANLNFK